MKTTIKLRLINLSILILAIQQPLFAQLTNLWTSQFPGSYFPYVEGDRMQFDGLGNSYSLITTNNFPIAWQTIKQDANGNVLWNNQDQNNSGNEQMAVNGHNGLFVSGDKPSSSNSIYTTYYNSSGIKTLGDSTTNTDGAYFPSLTMDNSGNAFVANYNNEINGNHYLQVTKYSSSQKLWHVNQYAPGNYSSYLDRTKCTCDSLGNCYVSVLYEYSDQNTGHDVLHVLKFDSNGTLVWEIGIEEGSWQPSDIKYNPIDNSIYLSYWIATNPKLVKISTDGSINWTKSFSLPQNGGNDNRIKFDYQGNILYLNAEPSSYGVMNPSDTLYKYNSLGTLLCKFFGGGAFDVDDKGYIYTVYSEYTNHDEYRHIQKFTPSGQFLFDQVDLIFFQSNSYSNRNDVYVAGTDNVYAMSEGSNSKYDASCSYTKAASKPASISGQVTDVCAGNSYTYSCSVANKATYYNWTVPAGTTISSGQGTTSIALLVSSNIAGSGVISVNAANCFGASSVRTLTIYGIPKTPGAITGSSSVCANQAGVPYFVAAVTGASSYNWTVPMGATVASGQGTTSITVNFGTKKGKVQVQAVSDCGASAVKSKSVSITCRESENELGDEDIVISPNPASNELQIQFATNFLANGKVEVLDITGKILHSNFITNGEDHLVIDLSGFQSGSYFIRIISEQGTVLKKIEIVH